MGRNLGLLAWTVCVFGAGLLVAGTGVNTLSEKASSFGIVCLLVGLLVLMLGWWRDDRRLKRAIQAGQPRPKVVALGGGSGLSVLLRGLKELDIDITAIVTVADDGGSSGRLRSDMSMPPPGDLRNCLVALADTEPLMERLWQYRFSTGEGLAGHSFGNLLLAAMTDVTGDFETAIREASRVLAVRGRVLPASRWALELVARLSDGSMVRGESKIPEAGRPIAQVMIEPANAEPLPEAIEAIKEADVIVIGPGSLYTSILPNLLVPGIIEAIRESPANTIYICNVMTQPGETENFTASQHVQVIHDHVGPHLFDYAIVNTAPIPEDERGKYRDQGSHPVAADVQAMHALGVNVVARNFLYAGGYVRHDARLVGEQILALMQRERPSPSMSRRL